MKQEEEEERERQKIEKRKRQERQGRARTVKRVRLFVVFLVCVVFWKGSTRHRIIIFFVFLSPPVPPPFSSAPAPAPAPLLFRERERMNQLFVGFDQAQIVESRYVGPDKRVPLRNAPANERSVVVFGVLGRDATLLRDDDGFLTMPPSSRLKVLNSFSEDPPSPQEAAEAMRGTFVKVHCRLEEEKERSFSSSPSSGSGLTSVTGALLVWIPERKQAFVREASQGRLVVAEHVVKIEVLDGLDGKYLQQRQDVSATDCDSITGAPPASYQLEFSRGNLDNPVLIRYPIEGVHFELALWLDVYSRASGSSSSSKRYVEEVDVARDAHLCLSVFNDSKRALEIASDSVVRFRLQNIGSAQHSAQRGGFAMSRSVQGVSEAASPVQEEEADDHRATLEAYLDRGASFMDLLETSDEDTTTKKFPPGNPLQIHVPLLSRLSPRPKTNFHALRRIVYDTDRQSTQAELHLVFAANNKILLALGGTRVHVYNGATLDVRDSGVLARRPLVCGNKRYADTETDGAEDQGPLEAGYVLQLSDVVSPIPVRMTWQKDTKGTSVDVLVTSPPENADHFIRVRSPYGPPALYVVDENGARENLDVEQGLAGISMQENEYTNLTSTKLLSRLVKYVQGKAEERGDERVFNGVLIHYYVELAKQEDDNDDDDQYRHSYRN